MTKVEVLIEMQFDLEKFKEFVEWAYEKDWKEKLKEFIDDAMEEISEERFKLNEIGTFQWKVKKIEVR